MLLSLNWIANFVDLSGIDTTDLVRRLILNTAEVEAVHKREISAHFHEVKTARVIAMRPHPDPKATKVRLATVDHGGSEPLEVVCGAPNCAVDAIVPFAPLGTTLPGFRIEERAIRGVMSRGMLCSRTELGLSADVDGLWILPTDTPIGVPLAAAGLPDLIEDTILEIDNKSLTHRPDLWGHFGFAREVAAILRRPLVAPPAPFPPSPEATTRRPLSAEIVAPDRCPRYMALRIGGVQIGPSPAWMRRRLEAAGVRAINNIVDITNYVMLELGQPLHAFDHREIVGNRIVVRPATPDERFITLDGREHALSPGHLVIADAERACALAGIMGGQNSGVRPDTTEIVLESANFQAAGIRRSSQALGLRTESSARFEKSLDPVLAETALRRAFALIRELCPQAHTTSDVVDVWPRKPDVIVISASFDRIRSRLGVDAGAWPDTEVEGILTRLGFDVGAADGSGIRTVEVPTWRATKDVSGEHDLVEEVGRMIGFDNIEPTPPLVPVLPPKPRNTRREAEHRVRDLWALELGFDEVILYSFLGAELLQACGEVESGLVELKNPRAAQADRLRPHLVPNLLDALGRNLRHDEAPRLFEWGRGYLPHADPTALPTETLYLGAALTVASGEDGATNIAGGANHGFPPGMVAFGQLKGAAEEFLTRLAIDGVAMRPWQVEDGAATPLPPGGIGPTPGWIHPGQALTFTLDGRPMGILTTVHPRVADTLGLPRGRAAVLQLNLDALFAARPCSELYRPLPTVPSSFLDFTANAVEGARVADMARILAEASIPALGDTERRVEFITVYRDAALREAGRKTITHRVHLQPASKALTGPQLEAARVALIAALTNGGFPVA